MKFQQLYLNSARGNHKSFIRREYAEDGKQYWLLHNNRLLYFETSTHYKIKSNQIKTHIPEV